MHSLSALFIFLLTDSMLLSLPLPKTYWPTYPHYSFHKMHVRTHRMLFLGFFGLQDGWGVVPCRLSLAVLVGGKLALGARDGGGHASVGPPWAGNGWVVVRLRLIWVCWHGREAGTGNVKDTRQLVLDFNVLSTAQGQYHLVLDDFDVLSF